MNARTCFFSKKADLFSQRNGQHTIHCIAMDINTHIKVSSQLDSIVNIDEEIGTVQTDMEEQRDATQAQTQPKKATGFTSLKRKVVAVGGAVALTMVATLAAATIQLYTCTRQLQVLDRLEDAAELLDALIAAHGA